MATITKRKSGWFVQIRRKGYEPEYRTFSTKSEATVWARQREAKIDQGDQPASARSLRTITLDDLLQRYVREVTPTKLGASAERLRLLKMSKASMCRLSLYDLSTASVAAYRDSRAREVSPGTIARELNLLQRVIQVARTDWGIGIPTNVVSLVRRLPVRNSRDRRLVAGELERLIAILSRARNPLVAPSILFAIETAMRRGELLNLRWQEIDLPQRTAHIPSTKTGFSRTIPLTDAAISILRSLPRNDERVFPTTATALRLAWNRIRASAGIPDLRFHDLRHEAISRFAELGLSTVELAAISGHRDLRMLTRYTHIQPSALAKKLAGRSWEREVGSV